MLKIKENKECEVYKDLEKDISPEILAEQYNDIMRNAYMGNKLDGIIPHMSIFEFFDEMKKPLPEEVIKNKEE